MEQEKKRKEEINNWRVRTNGSKGEDSQKEGRQAGRKKRDFAETSRPLELLCEFWTDR